MFLEGPHNENADYKEALLSSEEQEELNALRRTQIDRDFTDEERTRFFELSAREDKAREQRDAA